MPEPGTLQRALLQVAKALEPLVDAFTPDRAQGSLAELGIVVTPAQAASLSSPAQTLGVSVTQMLEDVAALSTAIDADDAAAIAAETLSVIERLVTAIGGLDDLQSAVAGLGLPPSATDRFAERLFNLLLVRALEPAQGVNEILELLGVLERERLNQGSTDPDAPQHTLSTFHFGELAGWLEDPLGALETHYGWSAPGFDGVLLLERLAALLARFDVPVFFDSAAAQPSLDFVFFQLRPRTDLAPRGLTLTARQSLTPGTIDFVADDFSVTFDLEAEIPFGLELTVQPPFDVSVEVPPGESEVSGAFDLVVAADRSAAAVKYLLIGEPDASRLEIERFAVELGAALDGGNGSFSLGGELGGGKVRIALDEADGFLGTILAGVELESDFDLGFGYRSDSGLFFEGSSTLEIQLPIHLDLGPIEVTAFTVAIGIDGSTFPATFTTDLKAALGPLVAVVEEMGLRADFRLTDERDGNAGPLDVTLAFEPPKGVGLSIDAGAVRGGGFLSIDPDRGEYAGVLELSILDFLTVTAIGVITTRMPDGSDGFTFIAIISVEFNPGLQLGFGFTLLGVGGLVGLNRSMDLDALAQGAKSGSIDTILFPQDVIANATRIISDLRTFFPPEQDVFIVGPMLKLGWGTPTLISLSLGVLIEIPGNIAIVGKLTVAIPDEKAALIIIQVAFIGALELDKDRGWFMATLYDSRVIYMTLDGGLGVLAAFGSEANFVVTVGGFHPSYDPPELPFPPISRIAINILNTPVASVRIDAYFAVTSNTVQFGARAELYFGISIANVEGHIGFDALFQFSPFYFIITISASLSVKLFGAGLFSVRFKGSLEGTSPWHIEGTGSISLLFWDVSVDFSETWGDKEDTTLPPISVMPLLVAELEKIENWTAELGSTDQLLVSLRAVDTGADLVLHPVGSLKVTQRAIPLELTLDKVGSQRPDDADRFTLDASTTGIEKRGTLRESFATAQFKELSDSEKLSAADFEPEDAGLELSITGNQTHTSYVTKRIARYEQIIIDSRFRLVLHFVTLVAGFFTHFLGGNAVARAAVSAKTRDQKHLFDAKITVQPNGYAVVSLEDNTPLDEAPVSFTSWASAHEYLAAESAKDPGFERRAHVVRPHEINRAAA